MAHWIRRLDDDDDEWFDAPGTLPGIPHYGDNMLTGTDVHEIEPKPPERTGLLDSKGRAIYRQFPPRPTIGFGGPEDEAELYDLDPEADYALVLADGEDPIV